MGMSFGSKQVVGCYDKQSFRLKKLGLPLIMVSVVIGPQANANVVGSDFQNFNPTTNGIDFVTVQSGQTLRPGIFNLGLFANYAVNAIPEFENGVPHNYPKGTARNTGTYSDFNLGVGLTSFVDVGLSFPAILQQSVKGKNARLQYESTGINEFRLNSKIKLIGNTKDALAAIATINMNRVENNPYAGEPTGPIYNIELAGHTSIGNAKLGLNAGYRKKNPGKKIDGSVADPYQDQFIGSAATSYLFKSIDTKLIFELFGSEPVNSKATASEVLQRSGEALVGIKHDFTSQLAFHAGATIGIIESPATPDWRVYAGINWNAGPLWGAKIARNPSPPRKAVAKVAKPVAPSTEIIPATPAPEVEARETYVLDNILFATDSSTQVIQGAVNELKELVDHLHQIPAWSHLVVEGHTDSVGDDEYNLDLSRRRAESIKLYLVKHFAIPPEKIASQGFGESRPIADNNNYQGRQQNRRVEIKIFD